MRLISTDMHIHDIILTCAGRSLAINQNRSSNYNDLLSKITEIKIISTHIPKHCCLLKM